MTVLCRCSRVECCFEDGWVDRAKECVVEPEYGDVEEKQLGLGSL